MSLDTAKYCLWREGTVPTRQPTDGLTYVFIYLSETSLIQNLFLIAKKLLIKAMKKHGGNSVNCPNLNTAN